jgi:hypothetical protein
MKRCFCAWQAGARARWPPLPQLGPVPGSGLPGSSGAQAHRCRWRAQCRYRRDDGDALVAIAVSMRLGQAHQQMGNQAKQILFPVIRPEVARSSHCGSAISKLLQLFAMLSIQTFNRSEGTGSACAQLRLDVLQTRRAPLWLHCKRATGWRGGLGVGRCLVHGFSLTNPASGAAPTRGAGAGAAAPSITDRIGQRRHHDWIEAFLAQHHQSLA